MSPQPWMKFYPADWRSDPMLRLCSIGARGLWMELICLMHEADPYGHLLINRKPPSDTQMGALTGVDPSTVRTLLSELEEAGVFSRNRAGVIYSRRMVADEKKAAVARANGKAGGNPNLCKTKPNPPSDNPPDKGGLNGGDNTQKSDSRYKNEIEDEDARARMAEVAKRVAAMAHFVGDVNARTDTAIVADWLKEGADPDVDIYPAVADVMGRTKHARIHTFGYFTNEIESHRRARLEPKQETSNVKHIGKGHKPDRAQRNAALLGPLARSYDRRVDSRSAGAGGIGAAVAGGHR